MIPPELVLKLNAKIPEITNILSSVCLKAYSVIPCPCDKHRIKTPRNIFSIIFVLYFPENLLYCLHVSLHTCYLFKAPLFSFPNTRTRLHVVRVATNARSSEEEDVPPEKLRGVTTTIVSNFTRSITAFSWALSNGSLKKLTEIMNSF